MRLTNSAKGFLGVVTLIGILCFCTTPAIVLAEGESCQATWTTYDYNKLNISAEQEGLNTSSRGYQARLRIYVCEPVSRWNANDGQPWHNALVDYAFDSLLNLGVDESFSRSLTFPAGSFGITEDNAIIYAVMFNQDPQGAYADPPADPFTAYFADAVAAAMPGETGYDDNEGTYSHTVLVEEVGTAS
jgi:hypothetical protein